MNTKKPEAEAAAAPKAADTPFPYTASINEPQTISLPVPDNVEPPPQNGGKKHAAAAHATHGHAHHDVDPDDLEDEIDEAIEDGDAHPTHKKKKSR